MKLSKNTMITALVIAMSLGACKKKDPDPTPSTNSGTTLAQDQAMIQSFFDEHRPAAEKFTVDAGSSQYINTQDGTILHFPAGVFVDAQGVPLTGNVTVYVREYNVASEMILGDRPTITVDGRLLESEGEFFIDAEQTGKEVRLEPGRAQVIIPVDSAVGVVNQEMQAWDGDTSYQTITTGYTYQNVLETVTMTHYINPGVTWEDNSNLSFTPFSYEMIVDSLGGWLNVDVINNDPRPKTTLLCYMDHYNDSTTMVYRGIQPSMLFFKPDGLNSVLKLYSPIINPPAGYAGLLSYQQSMPIGMTGKFLAVTSMDGKFYAELKTNTAVPAPVSGNNYSTLNFTMTEVTASQLLDLITSMN